MPECNCGALVQEGYACPQCGSIKYGYRARPFDHPPYPDTADLEAFEYHTSQEASHVPGRRQSRPPDQATAGWSIAEIQFEQAGTGFAFKVIARNVIQRHRMFLVDRKSASWHPIEAVAIQNSASRLSQHDQLTPFIEEIERRMIEDGWETLPAVGLSWFSKKFLRAPS